MNRIWGRKIKFNINKYTIKFMFINLFLMIIVKLVLFLIGRFLDFNMFNISMCLIISYLLILLVIYNIVINTDDFINMNFTEDNTKSLLLHLKYIDKLHLYLNNKKQFYKKEKIKSIDKEIHDCIYFPVTDTYGYNKLKMYKEHLSYISSGNEFWIVLNSLFDYIKDNDKFINLDKNICIHRGEVLDALKDIFVLEKNYLKSKHSKKDISYKAFVNNLMSIYDLVDVENGNIDYKNKMNEIQLTINILEKAINLNDKIYKLDKYVPHKDMINNLLDNWVILITNYIVDTDNCLNKELIDAFYEINTMAIKTIVEYNTQKEQVKKEENDKVNEIWTEQSKEYATLLKSISKDLK